MIKPGVCNHIPADRYRKYTLDRPQPVRTRQADDPSEGSHIRFERKGSVDVYKEVSVKNELFSRSQQAEEAFKRQHLSYIRNKNKQYILEMWRGISLVYVLLGINGAHGIHYISAPCRQQAINLLAPFNSSGNLCVAELLTVFQNDTTGGYSATELQCIGDFGFGTCFSTYNYRFPGVAITNNGSLDCSLCLFPSSTQRPCQNVIDQLVKNISANPQSCTTPDTNPDDVFTDTSYLTFLRFQLDITCSGVTRPSQDTDGYMAKLKFLTQCNCGALPCPPGIHCPENQPPILCPEGYYCPGYGGDKIICPEGSYCPEGSVKHTECAEGAVCVEGSTRQYEFVPILIVGLVFAIMWFIARTLVKISHEEEGKAKSRTPKEMSTLFSPKTKREGKSEAAGRLTIEFDDIQLQLPVPKGPCFGLCCRPRVPVEVDENGMMTRLKSVSGKLFPGTLTAVMGPSGSGKSTLLNVLCGKLDRTGGVVKVNGSEVNLTDLKEHIGFVPQSDILDAQLTVFEALIFSARIRLNENHEKRLQVVEGALTMLKLQHVKNSIIGDEHKRGISGGEKRRVNIGVELVAKPSALFLDEPTTGLDATAAQEIIRILQNIAVGSNMTVCAVIHQPRPSVLRCFDNILLLAKGGRQVWLGPSEGAIKHFEEHGFRLPGNVDLPDFLSDVISGLQAKGASELLYELDEKNRKGNVAGLVKAWSDMKVKPVVDQKVNTPGMSIADLPSRKVPYYFQISAYIIRGIQLRVIRSSRIFEDAIAHLITGFIIGLIFYQSPLFLTKIDTVYGNSCPATSKLLCHYAKLNRIGMWGFYNVMFLGLVSVSTANRTFGGRRKVLFWREASHGVSSLMYFLAENLCDLLASFINALFYTSAIQVAVPLEASLGIYWMLWTTLHFTVTGMSYVFSILIREISNSTIAGVVFAIIFSMFEGFIEAVFIN
ncbi:hypothetical protein AAMO2058_000969800 [Amorphochlora amoebiformis]